MDCDVLAAPDGTVSYELVAQPDAKTNSAIPNVVPKILPILISITCLDYANGFALWRSVGFKDSKCRFPRP